MLRLSLDPDVPGPAPAVARPGAGVDPRPGRRRLEPAGGGRRRLAGRRAPARRGPPVRAGAVVVVAHRPGRGDAADRRPRRAPAPTGRSRSNSPPRPSRGGRRRRWPSGRRADGESRPASPSAACHASSWPMIRPCGSRSARPAHRSSRSSRRDESRPRMPASFPRGSARSRSPIRSAGGSPRLPMRRVASSSTGWPLGARPGARSRRRVRYADAGTAWIPEDRSRPVTYQRGSACARRPDPGTIDGAARRADPGATVRATSQVGGYNASGQGGLCPRGLRRAGAIRDPGHRRGDGHARPRIRPGGGLRPARRGAHATPLEGRPDGRGHPAAARDGGRPRAVAREGTAGRSRA